MIRFGRIMVSLKQPLSFMKKRAPPVVLQIPSVSAPGNTVGTVLTRVPGTWKDATSVTWAWFSGTTQRQVGGATYTVVGADSGATITIKETATNPGGSTTQQSTGVVIS